MTTQKKAATRTAARKTSTKKAATKKAATKKAATKKAATKKTAEFAILDDIVANRQLRQALSGVFDFEPTRISTGRSARLGFHLSEGWHASKVASDGSGGIFAFCRRVDDGTSRLIYVSSEGQSGTVGGSISEWLALMLELPFWRDLLKFSGGGRLREMRRAAVHFERDTAKDTPEVIEWRTRLFQALKLDRSPDPVGRLHQNIRKGAGLEVLGPEPYESLFGPFVLRDYLRHR